MMREWQKIIFYSNPKLSTDFTGNLLTLQKIGLVQSEVILQFDCFSHKKTYETFHFIHTANALLQKLQNIHLTHHITTFLKRKFLRFTTLRKTYYIDKLPQYKQHDFSESLKNSVNL